MVSVSSQRPRTNAFSRAELLDADNRDPGIAVRTALALLNAVDAEIIRLVHWEGFTQGQVATILGKRPGTICSRYHRARRQLQKNPERRGPGRGRGTAPPLSQEAAAAAAERA